MANLLSFTFIILLSFASSPSTANAEDINSLEALDRLIRDYTFKPNHTMNKFKTGEIHNVHLPSNLSRIRANAVRFRCGSLTRYGARINEFGLGVGVTVNPCVERVMVITWSTSIYNAEYYISGYQLVSPIIGLAAYNAGEKSIIDPNSSYPFEIQIRSGQGNPITVDFTNITSRNHGDANTTMCASFEKDGEVRLRKPISPRVCGSTSNGHYGLVVKLPATARGGGGRAAAAAWKVVVASSVGGVLGIVLLGLLATAVFVKVKKKAKMVEMERRAYEEEALQVSMVGHVTRAPVASATRTLPTIENHPVHIPYNLPS